MDDINIKSLGDEIKDRQEQLLRDIDLKAAVVIGLGGIGSWIAVDLALMGIETLYLYDDDIIEASNLNRTLFKLSDVGRKKTDAVKDLIRERREDCIVACFQRRFTINDFRDVNNGGIYIFDCSDTTKLKREIREEGLFYSRNYVKLGYDGFEATMDHDLQKGGEWGEDNSYAVTPSFFGAPQVISAIAVMEMVIESVNARKVVNFDVRYLLADNPIVSHDDYIRREEEKYYKDMNEDERREFEEDQQSF